MVDPKQAPAGDKRAQQIAGAIEATILAEHWPSGQRLGNEAELARRHGVSRWTMREAVAILESTGSIVARRGGGGGLFVAAPAADLARNAIASHLESAHMPIDAIIAVRLTLAKLAIERATARLRPDGVRALAGFLLAAEAGGSTAMIAMGAARQAIRKAADSPPLDLFLSALSELVLQSSWSSALDDATFVAMIDQLAGASRRRVLAYLAGDLKRAVAAEEASLEVIRELHVASSLSGEAHSVPDAPERAYRLYPPARPRKKADALARALRRRIADERLRPGDNLGSEADLTARYDVGRPVLREAIRVLERAGIATMRRGGASGLTITPADPARVIALARADLARTLVSPPDRAAVRQVLLDLPGNSVATLLLSIVAD